MVAGRVNRERLRAWIEGVAQPVAKQVERQHQTEDREARPNRHPRRLTKKVPGGVEVRITNEELANAANVTPFTASRLMSDWQRDRALVKRRGAILLRSPERLLLRLV